MYNNKGFTLVEILATIVLISLLLGLGIPGVMKISENMKKRAYNTKVDLIEQAGTLWGQDNKTLLQSDKCDINGNDETGSTTKGRETNCYIIEIEALIEDDYLDADSEGKFINPIDNNDIKNECVWVYKKNNRVQAKFGIDCNGCVSVECKNNP